MNNRNYGRLALISFLVAAVALAITAVAHAHLVELLFSYPQNGEIIAVSPPAVEAIFNEEMSTETSTIRVLNAAGEQIDNGDGGVNLDDPNHASMIVSLPPNLPDGEYVVDWYVVLLDTDPTKGQFNFFVGDEAGAEAANFTPIQLTSYDPTVTADGPNTIPWMIAGSIFGFLILLIPGLIIYKKYS